MKLTPKQWEKLLNLEIVDDDGFRDGTWETEMTFSEFEKRANECTVDMNTWKNIESFKKFLVSIQNT